MHHEKITLEWYLKGKIKRGRRAKRRRNKIERHIILKNYEKHNTNLQERSQMKITKVSDIVVVFAAVYCSRIQISHPMFLTTVNSSYRMTYKKYALSRHTFLICSICIEVFNCCNPLQYF